MSSTSSKRRSAKARASKRARHPERYRDPITGRFAPRPQPSSIDLRNRRNAFNDWLFFLGSFAIAVWLAWIGLQITH